MMRAVVTLCVRHFGSVSFLTLLALVLGCWGALQSPLDVFPEFVPSQVDIQTEAQGFAPQQVEELVTRQVENAVNGAAGLATLRSESIPGLSVVTVTFRDGIDVHVARQGISERLSELGSSLPAGRGHAETLAAGIEHDGPAQDRPAVGQASMRTTCAIPPTGSSSRGCSRCPGSPTSSSSAATPARSRFCPTCRSCPASASR